MDYKETKPLRSILKGQAKDALVFSGSTLANQLGSFFLLPLYWRKLSPQDYGILAVIAILAPFQRLLSNLMLELSVTRFFYEWPDVDRRRNLGALWVWNWASTGACCGVFLLALPHFSRALFPEVAFDPYLMLGTIATALSNLFLIPATVIRIKSLPWLFATYNFTSFAASTSLGLWFVLLRNEHLQGYLMSTIWANLLMAVIGGAIMLAFARPCLSSPGLREALKFSFAAVPSTIVSTLSGILDRFLLNYFANLHTLGVYAVSMKFSDVLSGLHASLKMAYGPFMMKAIAEDEEGGRETVAAVTPFYVIPYILAGLCLTLFIGPFVHLINKPAYFEIVQWVPWTTGVSVISCMYFYYTNGMFLANRTELLFVPAAIQIVVLLLSGVFLIGTFQLGGLMACRYLSTGVFFGVSLYLSQKVYPLPHRWRDLIGLPLAAVAFAAAGQFIGVSNPYWEVTLKVPLVLLFAAMVYWVMRGQRRLSVQGSSSQELPP